MKAIEDDFYHKVIEAKCTEGLLKACNFIKKETLEQVFSCEFCEISKNTFSYRTPPAAVS